MQIIEDKPPVVQISVRGQVTLPVEIRHALGVVKGDHFIVFIEDGRIVLAPAAVTPLELYTDEREAEFNKAAEMSGEELKKARVRWKI